MANADVGNLHVRIGLDSTGFRQGIADINRKMRLMKSEFDEANVTVGKHGTELDKLRLKSDSLSQQKELQRQKVAALQEAYKQSADSKGIDAKATTDLKIQLNKAKVVLAGMEQELSGLNRSITTQSSSWYQLGQQLEPIGQSLQDVGGKMQAVGKDMSLKVTNLLMKGVAAAAVKIGSDFEASMSKVAAISGATGEDLDALTEKAKEMGASTKFSASQSAEALQYMAMAGWDTGAMMDGLGGVMTLAAASGESLARVSDIVTDAMTAFGMEAHQAGDFADLLANTASNANTNVGMMGETFKYVAPIFGALGYSAEDASLAIGLMANSGIKGSQAGTTLRGALTQLTNPTAAVASAMEEMGVSLTDASGEMLPFQAVMGQLREGFSSLSAEQQAQTAATMFGQQAMSGMLAIINASDDDYAKLTEATREYAGAAQTMADTMQDNLQGQLTILRSQLEGVAIQIYEVLVPTLRSMVEVLQRVVKWFADLNPAVQTTIVRFGAVLAAIGPTLIILGKMVATVGKAITTFAGLSKAIATKTAVLKAMTVASSAAAVAGKALVAVKTGLAVAMGVLLSPIGLVVAAIAGLVAIGVLLYKNWDKVKAIAASLWGSIVEGWEILREITSEAWGALVAIVQNAWDTVTGLVGAALGAVREIVLAGWEYVRTITSEVWGALVAIVQNAWDIVKGLIGAALGAVREIVLAGWEYLRTITSEAWGALVAIVQNAWNTVTGLVGAALGAVREIVLAGWEYLCTITAEVWSALVAIVQNAWHTVTGLVGSALGAVREIVLAGWEILREITSEVWGALVAIVQNAWDTVTGLVGAALGAVEDVMAAGWGYVTDIVEGVLTRIKAAISGAWEWVKGITVGAWESLRESIAAVVASVVGVFTSFVDTVKSIFENAVDAILGPFRRIGEGLSNLKDTVKDALSSLNPFARHSPSLVDNVQAGCAVIDEAYSRLAERVHDAVGGMYDDIAEGPEREALITTAALGMVVEETTAALEGMGVAAREAGQTVEGFSDYVRTLRSSLAEAPGVLASWSNSLTRFASDILRVTAATLDGVTALDAWNAVQPEAKVLTITQDVSDVQEVFASWQESLEQITSDMQLVTTAIEDGVTALKDWNAIQPEEKVFKITKQMSEVFDGHSIPRRFSGTSFFTGGLAMVGELGPELVRLPKGSQIYSDRESRQMVQQAGTRQEPSVTLHIDRYIQNTQQDIEQLAYQFELHRRRMSFGRGGW